jgi:hypothetical protein
MIIYLSKATQIDARALLQASYAPSSHHIKARIQWKERGAALSFFSKFEKLY